MTIKSRLSQAYKQAPWRLATQKGVFFLILAVLFASVLWILLTVTVQAASAGLETQQLESDKERLQRSIASLRTDIAIASSASEMEARAAKLGFILADRESISYIVIPGYIGRKPVISAPPPSLNQERVRIKPVYTQSLSEWLFQGILKLNQTPGGWNQ